MLTQEYLQSLFVYDDEEDISQPLIWRERLGVSTTWNVKYANKKAGTKKSDAKRYSIIRINRKHYFTHRIVFLYHHG